MVSLGVRDLGDCGKRPRIKLYECLHVLASEEDDAKRRSLRSRQRAFGEQVDFARCVVCLR